MTKVGHIRMLALVMAGLIGLLAGPAGAVSFDGVDYTLSYTTIDAVNAIYDVTLTIDPSGATFDQTLLKAAGFKIAAQSKIEGGTSQTSAPGSWTFFFNGQFDSGGCADTPDAGFTCWQNNGAGEDIADGPFTFTARLDLDAPASLLTGTDAASIKALYLCDSSDTSCEGLTQLSENTTLTPQGGNETPQGGNETPQGGNETPQGGQETPQGGNETTVPGPAPLVLIGLGLGGMAAWGRLRRR
jgi:hypothetical protein